MSNTEETRTRARGSPNPDPVVAVAAVETVVAVSTMKKAVTALANTQNTVERVENL